VVSFLTNAFKTRNSFNYVTRFPALVETLPALRFRTFAEFIA
jgi:hypothetical protein